MQDKNKVEFSEETLETLREIGRIMEIAIGREVKEGRVDIVDGKITDKRN